MDNWHEIVDSNIAGLVASVRRIVDNGHDAEDVVQEVFAEAYQFAGTKKVDNWPGLLRRMGQRRAINHLRRKGRSAGAASSETLSGVPANQDDPSQTYNNSELQNQLRQALKQLSNQESAAFSAAYFDGLSRSAIAATLETTENAVNIAIYKATKKLKTLLNS